GVFQHHHIRSGRSVWSWPPLFGENRYERDARILRGDPVLAPLAAALPSLRLPPPAHSARVENEDREPGTSLLSAREAYAGVALAGPGAEMPACQMREGP
ncbi:hypothetical protein Vretifemale_17901, partial [Volvox reticuliferus]